jgi:hypothetical protein
MAYFASEEVCKMFAIGAIIPVVVCINEVVKD